MNLKFILAAIALAIPGAAYAQQGAGAYQKLLECRSLLDGASRLACFDRETATMQAAEQAGDLLIVEQEQLRQTRRTLFGLALPQVPLFSRARETEQDERLETKIRSASLGKDGKWILELEEGGRWYQVDSRKLISDPRPGHEIRIRKAAMGSFLANVDGQTAIRVRRSE